MDYITAEQFLEQPKGVQKVFIDWWQPEMYDLFFRNFTNPNGFLGGIYKSCIQDYEMRKDATRNDTWLPLLTEGQLRKFIEDKTKFKIIAVPFYSDALVPNYRIKFKDMGKGKLMSEPNFCIQTDDLLQAYWKVAREIAKEDTL